MAQDGTAVGKTAAKKSILLAASGDGNYKISYLQQYLFVRLCKN